MSEANALETGTDKQNYLKKSPSKSVSIKHGLRTGYKIRTRYKTRTAKHGLGIKYGLGIKGGLQNTDWV